MFTCFQISKSILRYQHPINALFLSTFILVLINPNILFSVGFQLSITAVGAIIIGVPKLLALWYPKHWFINKTYSIICMSVCAQIGVLPLSIYYFNQFSSLFLLANIPIMFIIVFILSSAILVVTLAYFDQNSDILIRIYNKFILLIIEYIDWIAQLELFILKKLYITSISLTFTYLLYVYLLYFFKNYRKAYKWITPVLFFTILISFWDYNQRLLKSELWILNNYKNTVITELTSNRIKIHYGKQLAKEEWNYLLQPIIGNLHYSKADTLKLQNSYEYRGKNIQIINSKNTISKTTCPIIILDKSPKINIERLIKNNQPKLIIASSSNYPSFIKKWKATCSKEKVPFYSISENGALNLTNAISQIN